MSLPLFRVHVKGHETIVLKARSPKACREWATAANLAVTKIKRTAQPQAGEKVVEVKA